MRWGLRQLNEAGTGRQQRVCVVWDKCYCISYGHIVVVTFVEGKQLVCLDKEREIRKERSLVVGKSNFVLLSCPKVP